MTDLSRILVFAKEDPARPHVFDPLRIRVLVDRLGAAYIGFEQAQRIGDVIGSEAFFPSSGDNSPVNMQVLRAVPEGEPARLLEGAEGRARLFPGLFWYEIHAD